MLRTIETISRRQATTVCSPLGVVKVFRSRSKAFGLYESAFLR